MILSARSIYTLYCSLFSKSNLVILLSHKVYSEVASIIRDQLYRSIIVIFPFYISKGYFNKILSNHFILLSHARSVLKLRSI